MIFESIDFVFLSFKFISAQVSKQKRLAKVVSKTLNKNISTA